MKFVKPKNYKAQTVLRPEEKYRGQYDSTDFKEGDLLEIRLLHEHRKVEIRRGLVTNPNKSVKRHDYSTGSSYSFSGVELLVLRAGTISRDQVLEQCDDAHQPQVPRKQSYPLQDIAAVYMIKPAKKTIPISRRRNARPGPRRKFKKK